MSRIYNYILLYTLLALSIISIVFIEKTLLQKELFIALLLLLTYLIHNQLTKKEQLKHKTAEIDKTMKLLQVVLDAEPSLLVVSNGKRTIYANKTLLNFFHISTLSHFNKRYSSISKIFETADEDTECYENDKELIEYIEKKQDTQEFKLKIKKDDSERFFKAHTRKLHIDDETLYLIILDEITKDFIKMKELEQSASIDVLTHLFNRAKFNDILTQEIVLSKKAQSPLCIIFLDIDHFKVVNDTYGHNVGDEVLKELSMLLTSSIRQSDFVARWGGEEFIITLQTTYINQASIIAEKIRRKVEEHKFNGVGKVTISLGVTQYISYESEDVLIKRVDSALYKAKESGRNKVVVY